MPYRERKKNMVIHTYGDPGDPVVILLHPMLITGEQMYDMLGKKLSGRYFFISPDQGGHGDEKEDYVSPEKDAEELYLYLKENGYTDIALLFTASLGGLPAMWLLSKDDLTFHSVHIDGTPLAKIGPVTALIIQLMYQKYRKQALKDPSVIAKALGKQYGEETGRNMARQFAKLSAASVWRIVRYCTIGSAVPLSDELCSRMTFEWGEKEIDAKGGIPLAKKMYPKAKVIVREGWDHCEYMAKNRQQYADELSVEMAERQ